MLCGGLDKFLKKCKVREDTRTLNFNPLSPIPPITEEGGPQEGPNMKIILAFLAVLALTLGGCATAPKEDSDLMTRSLEQAVRMNEIKLSKACMDAQNKAIATAKNAAISAGYKSTEFPDFFEEPACVVEERSKKALSERVSGQEALDKRPVVLPENIGISMKEASRMSRDELCEHMVARAIAAKGVAAVLGDRSVGNNTVRYDQASNECLVINAVKEHRRFRWNDLFRSFPSNGYTPEYRSRYPYSTGRVPVGVEIAIDTKGLSPYGRAGTYPNHDGAPYGYGHRKGNLADRLRR